MYHPESIKMIETLRLDLGNLKGGTTFRIGDTSVEITGRDGLGGLIEEWFGVWAENRGFKIRNPKKERSSQTFPDYYVGDDNFLLEVKCFDSDCSPNFDLANFESYCESVAGMPSRVDCDYLIFGYKLVDSGLSITDVWLKKIWEISCSSELYPLKTQNKRGVIYNIRPATWYSKSCRFKAFSKKEEFIDALFETQKRYRGHNHKDLYLSNLQKGL